MATPARRIALLACLVSVALPSGASATHAEPLRAQYHLDGRSTIFGDTGAAFTTPDSSGHGLTGTGTVNNGPTVITGGRFGNAFRFFGTTASDTDGVQVADSDLLEPETITVVAWVRAGASPGAYRYVVSKGGNNCTASSYALTSWDSGGLAFYVLNGPSPTVSPVATPADVWDGKWHLAVGTFDGATVRLYVDGKQVGGGTPASPGIEYGLLDDRFFVGTYASSTSCPGTTGFVGDIDEVRVLSRSLSATEVAGLFPVPPSRPAATFKFAKSPTVKRAIWLSALGSKPSTGRRITKYEWDWNADGRYEAECGASAPAVSHPFSRVGKQKVRLRVTDTAGRSSVLTKTIDVARANRNLRSADVFMCEKPLGGNQPDTPGCVKTFAFSIVEVNSRGDEHQCFRITPRREIPTVKTPQPRRLAQDPAGSLDRYTVYSAKLIGPLAMNGIPIPVPGNVQTEYDSWRATVGIGKFPILLGFPGGKLIRVHEIPLEFKVEPKKGRFALPPLKSGKLSIFGLKMGGGIEIALLRGRRSEVKVAAILPSVFKFGTNKEAEGHVVFRGSNVGGFEFEGMRIAKIPHVFLGPLLVNDLFFEYKRTGNVWRGGANFQLAAVSPVQIRAAPPPPDYGFGLRDGKFDYAGGGVAFPIPPRPQLFPGVGLVEIGGAIGVKPTRFTGRLAIDAGAVFAIDGSAFVGLASPQQPYDFPEEYAPPGLEFLAGRRLESVSIAAGGVAKLLVPVVGDVPLVNSYLFYSYPDYAEFGGGFKYSLGNDDDETVKIEGGVGGWIQLLQKRFNLEGKVQGCIDIDIVDVCKGVDAVVSSRGIGLCTVVPIPVSPFGPTIPVDAGIGYHWGQSFPDLKLFTCSTGPYREEKPELRAAATGPRKFTLPGGLPSAMVRVKGVGAPPKLVLTAPGGKRVSIPQTGQQPVDRNVIGITRDGQRTTLVALRKPRAGTWSVAPQPGSQIASVAVANGLRKPRVKASVGGQGRTRVLSYEIGPAAGQRVTFFERGPRTYRRLGVANALRGRIRFRPGAGQKGARRILAVVERGGVVTDSLVVASYTAPANQRPAKPKRVRVKRTKAGLLVTWRGDAPRWSVLAHQANGIDWFEVTRKRRIVFRSFNPFASGRVEVRALGVDGATGRAATAKVKARRPPRP